MRHVSRTLIILILAVITLSVAACTAREAPVGPEGPAGPQGRPGAQGTQGEQGPAGAPGADGLSFMPAEFIGSEACAECHQDTYDVFARSGHAWKLNEVVDGNPPDYPFSDVPRPPDGYTWDDIAYIIGGYNWKARFIDHEGFIITGDEDATTQYNLRNDEIDLGNEWVAYHAGEEIPYDCGTCHTTGYVAEGNQDGLPGLIGTWALDGVQCEECHGPGSNHASYPLSFQPVMDRDSEACGDCHVRGGTEEVSASNGFIQHHDQYEDLFMGKHIAIDCVVCHNPHTGVVQLRQDDLQTTRTQCENCHFDQASNSADEAHDGINIDCIDCHMPRVIKSAVGDPERFTGDVRTHLMTIDPQQIGQFSEDGSVVLSPLSLDFSCRGCHNPDGRGRIKTDEELITTATGYHNAVALPIVEDQEVSEEGS